MNFKSLPLIVLLLTQAFAINAQITTPFNYATDGQYVCLVEASVDNAALLPQIILHFGDAQFNNWTPFDVYRRPLYGNGSDWQLVASDLAPGTASWTDSNINRGEVWEYQVKRLNGANNTIEYTSTALEYQVKQSNSTGTATGYTSAVLDYDQSNYRGQMILAIANDVMAALPTKIERLQRDLTGDGWFVNIVETEKGNFDFDDGANTIIVKNQIEQVYNSAPFNDKPKVLFILGHVPLPRSGQGLQAPDNHIEFTGARGADCFYADIDGIFTDTATYDIPELSNNLTRNLPGDYRWDQDVIPSELEMAFGRVDFFRVSDNAGYNEIDDISNYLDRLHDFRFVNNGKIGTKTAFNSTGYSNSYYGSYRSLPALSGGANVIDSAIDTDSGHNQWVSDNGPFLVYMQNQWIPQLNEWENIGMDALVYTSDQSAWGYGDIPQYGGNYYSRIRRILRYDTKCLIALWTTSAINIFHQAGMGDALGIACKQIMEHNLSNQKLEKPQVSWDTEAWWNRTHFNFYGDPTLRLYQTLPPSNLVENQTAAEFTLEWTASADANLLGYHVYKSDREFGIYNKISGSILTQPTFTDPSYTSGDWYMVRAIAEQTTGSGVFHNPSQGIFIQGNIALSNENTSQQFTFNLFPNPVKDHLVINAPKPIDKLQVIDNLGRVIVETNNVNSTNYSLDVNKLHSGTYCLKLFTKNGIRIKKFMKN